MPDIDFFEGLDGDLNEPAAPPKNSRMPADFKPAVERAFTEPCPSCRGSGRWGWRAIKLEKPINNRAQLAPLTNCEITSVDYSGQPRAKNREVVGFREWDGESYVDEFFCTNRCAAAFGRMAAKSGHIESVAYRDAMCRDRGQEPR